MSVRGDEAAHALIVGVPKAGTTTLFWLLSQHPRITTSRVKEPRFFTPLRWGRQPPPEGEYAREFPAPDRATRWLLEASSDYVYGGEATARAIEERLPGSRVIILLRDPVERFWSEYRFDRARLAVGADFTFDNFIGHCTRLREQGVDAHEDNEVYFALSAGFYDEYVPAWLDTFGERCRLWFFDDLRRDAHELAAEVCAWLDLDPLPDGALDTERQNRTVGFRHAGLQRLALRVNKRAEALLRRVPKLKQRVRDAYLRLNGKPIDTPLTPERRMRLEGIYEDANRQFAASLRARGYEDLPDWLDPADKGAGSTA